MFCAHGLSTYIYSLLTHIISNFRIQMLTHSHTWMQPSLGRDPHILTHPYVTTCAVLCQIVPEGAHMYCTMHSVDVTEPHESYDFWPDALLRDFMRIFIFQTSSMYSCLVMWTCSECLEETNCMLSFPDLQNCVSTARKATINCLWKMWTCKLWKRSAYTV